MGNRGHFIVIEGLEGAGKSTALNTVMRVLTHCKQVPKFITTREPGTTQVGEVVRKLMKDLIPHEPLDPKAELLLLYAARTQLVEHVIRPALQKGLWVLSDRFELSTFAYQGGGRQLDTAMLAHLSSFCLQGFQPDLTIFLDISPEQGLERAQKRAVLDRMEQESLSFFNDVYRRYHECIKTLRNVVVIDASQSLDGVTQDIEDALKRYIDAISS